MDSLALSAGRCAPQGVDTACIGSWGTKRFRTTKVPTAGSRSNFQKARESQSSSSHEAIQKRPEMDLGQKLSSTNKEGNSSNHGNDVHNSWVGVPELKPSSTVASPKI